MRPRDDNHWRSLVTHAKAHPGTVAYQQDDEGWRAMRVNPTTGKEEHASKSADTRSGTSR